MDIIYTLVKTNDLYVSNQIEGVKIDYSQSIRQEFDNIIEKNIYDSPDTCHELYKELYKKFKNIIKDKNKTYVNFSSDCAISAATIASLNELYAYRCGPIYKSDLKIIYINLSTDLELNNYDIIDKITNEIASKSIVSNLISMSSDDIKRSYTKHMIDLELSQFIFIGPEQITSLEENLFLETNTKYYMFSNLYKKLEQILDKIVDENKNSPIAIIFNMNSIHPKLNINTTNMSETKKTGWNIDQINMIINKLSKLNNIKMIDITGYNLYSKINNNNDNINNSKDIKNTENIENMNNLQLNINFIMKIYGGLLKLKEYSLNIFTETSRFLIYKPMEEIYDSEESGYHYGWYVLRNIHKGMKQELLETLDHDSIIILDIPDDDDPFKEVEIMISTTCINEQNEKCYYMATSYKDCCLYPDEKLDMMFELINNQ